MRSPIALRIFLFLVGIVAFSLATIPFFYGRAYASGIIFQDNFDDGNADGWTSIMGPPSLWQVKDINGNKMYGARIESGSTIIDSVAANVNTPNYQIDFDYLPVTNNNTLTVDRNLDFRWVPDTSLGGWKIYEVHFLGENYFWTNFGYPDSTSPIPLANNQINHIRAIFQNQRMQLFLNGTQIIDYLDTSYSFTGTDKIGLRIGTGAAYPTEVWFDNIVVTSLDATPTPLTVPYFNQNDSPWGQTEYDHAWGKLLNPTMDRWGCVVASAAMVLKYHNINEFTDGTPINPGSLNEWLKNNKGYLTGYNNMDGFYSYFNWPVIGKLTNDLFDANKSTVKLMHKRTYPSSETTTLLNDDLNLRKFPDILWVKNANTSSHFVVAKGVSGNTYSINDPEWNYPTLTSFNNTYMQLDRYVPSNTNLSYFVAVVNPSVELLITNPQNSKTGKYFDNGQLQSSNEINNASYSFQAPISNPNNQNLLEELGTGVNEFLLPEPENGKYQIKLSSNKTGFYEINIANFEKNGNNALNKIKGVISSNNDETIGVDYSQDQVSEIKRVVSAQDLISDLSELKKLNLIDNGGIYNSLLAKATISQILNSINKKTSLNILNSLLNELNAQRGKHITEDAYQILLYDVNYLNK